MRICAERGVKMKERLIIIEFAVVIVFFLTAYWILFRKITDKKPRDQWVLDEASRKLNAKKGPTL